MENGDEVDYGLETMIWARGWGGYRNGWEAGDGNRVEHGMTMEVHLCALQKSSLHDVGPKNTRDRFNPKNSRDPFKI